MLPWAALKAAITVAVLSVVKPLTRKDLKPTPVQRFASSAPPHRKKTDISPYFARFSSIFGELEKTTRQTLEMYSAYPQLRVQAAVNLKTLSTGTLQTRTMKPLGFQV